MKYKTLDEYTEKYSELCNFFWYQTHPEWQRDGHLHTSSVCRRLALEVFELLGIEAPEEQRKP
jgi:hypothetical protein